MFYAFVHKIYRWWWLHDCIDDQNLSNRACVLKMGELYCIENISQQNLEGKSQASGHATGYSILLHVMSKLNEKSFGVRLYFFHGYRNARVVELALLPNTLKMFKVSKH